MAFNSIVATVANSGVNTSGLGNWSWIKIQGKMGKSTTVITAYCPCMSNCKRPETVYSQHKQYLVSKHQDICPREAFWRDLLTFTSQCQSRNEQIILCMDLNEDTNRNNGPTQQTLLHTNNLTDVLKYRHDIPTPSTHNRGSTTIDAIYASQELLAVENAGWLRFGEGIRDHRIAFIDIDLSLLIGKEKHKIVKRSVHNYVQVVEEKILRSDIPNRLDNFRRNHHNWDEKRIGNELNQIDKTRVGIALQSEKKCRKLCTGVVPYAPDDIQCFGRENRLWTMIINKKGGSKISSKLIVRQAKKNKNKKPYETFARSNKKLRATAWKKYKTNKTRAMIYATNSSNNRQLMKKKEAITTMLVKSEKSGAISMNETLIEKYGTS